MNSYNYKLDLCGSTKEEMFMPIYEYLCEECTHLFEALVIHDEKVNCPKCNSQKLSKQYSRFGMSSGASGGYDSLPLYKGNGGGGCGCTPATCGCRHG